MASNNNAESMPGGRANRKGVLRLRGSSMANSVVENSYNPEGWTVNQANNKAKLLTRNSSIANEQIEWNSNCMRLESVNYS